jgi:outer membrane murein-binding lipoprotein Lpp
MRSRVLYVKNARANALPMINDPRLHDHRKRHSNITAPRADEGIDMLTSVSFLKKNAARFVCAAVIFCSALLSGCAGGSINNATQTSAQPPVRPDNIYVYTFNSDPEQVKLDNGGVLKKLKSQLGGSSAAQQQSADALAVREQVANEIVHQLQSMGLRAIRSDIPAPADQNVLMVEGSFDTIDSGNRRRRMLIGLGAGKSEVSSSVQILYKPAGGTARLVQSFNATGDSGNAPGMVETAGVGAAAGSIATSAAVGGGLHAMSETKKTGVSADAQRLADAVAKQVAQIGVSAGWLSTAHLKG